MDIAELYHEQPKRYPELKGKVAVVTGASRGIGLGIAARLAAEGMCVVMAGIELDELNAASQALNALQAETLAVPGNLIEYEQIENLFDQTKRAFGKVDVLVNNAADLWRTRLLDMGLIETERELAINIKTPLMCSKFAAQFMRDVGGGSIINISSVGGLRAHERGLPYDATKGAIDAMTRALAVDLAEYGIRANAIAPGVTHTWRSEEFVKNRPEVYAEVIQRVPLKRSGTPLDIASAVAFLASPDAAYITGQIIYVDGGITAQLSPPHQML